MTVHARQQVLNYFKEHLTEQLSGVTINVHRVAPKAIEDRVYINLMIDDETISGANDSDELEDTFGVMSRVAPLMVELTVAASTAQEDVNAMAGHVEVAFATDDGLGEHTINGAQVSSQYIATTSEDQDEGHIDHSTLTLIFQTSYRTEVGKPFTLV